MVASYVPSEGEDRGRCAHKEAGSSFHLSRSIFHF